MEVDKKEPQLLLQLCDFLVVIIVVGVAVFLFC